MKNREGAEKGMKDGEGREEETVPIVKIH